MKKLVALLVMGLLPLTSFASIQCDAKVSHVLVYADGTVGVKHSEVDDFVFICNLKTERLGVSTATCAMWTSLLLNVKENSGTAQFYYQQGTGTCRNLLPYDGALAPWYIGELP